MSNITTYMVAMATLPLNVRSTSKFLIITLIRTVNSEAKLVLKFLILTRCKTDNRTLYHNQVKRMCHKIVTLNDVGSSATYSYAVHALKSSKPKEKWRKTEQKLFISCPNNTRVLKGRGLSDRHEESDVRCSRIRTIEKTSLTRRP